MWLRITYLEDIAKKREITKRILGVPMDDAVRIMKEILEDPTGKSDEEFKIIIQEIENKVLQLKEVLKWQ